MLIKAIENELFYKEDAHKKGKDDEVFGYQTRVHELVLSLVLISDRIRAQG